MFATYDVRLIFRSKDVTLCSVKTRVGTNSSNYGLDSWLVCTKRDLAHDGTDRVWISCRYILLLNTMFLLRFILYLIWHFLTHYEGFHDPPRVQKPKAGLLNGLETLRCSSLKHGRAITIRFKRQGKFMVKCDTGIQVLWLQQSENWVVQHRDLDDGSLNPWRLTHHGAASGG
jgi:hypothetical protein